MSANDMQIAGDHYKRHGDTGEQHWDRVHRLRLDYMQGQVTKYVERCWDKNGIEDLEKASHFLTKYIEQAKATGRQGKLEASRNYIYDRLNELLAERMKVYPHDDPVKADANPMNHYSTARFCFEGIKEDKVHYRCRVCREHLHLQLTQRPEHVHATCVDGSEATPAYVQQG